MTYEIDYIARFHKTGRVQTGRIQYTDVEGLMDGLKKNRDLIRAEVAKESGIPAELIRASMTYMYSLESMEPLVSIELGEPHEV